MSTAANRMRRHRARQRKGLVPLTIEADEVNTIEVLLHFGFLKAETEDRQEIARAFSRSWAWLTTQVIDVGLRLADVEAEGLQSEEVSYRESESAIRGTSENGATEAEIEFLLHSRVELNAFASDQLIDWIERKLKEHGVKKLIPDDDTLAAAYRRMRRQALVQARIDEVLEELDDDEDELQVPDDLRKKIEACHAKHPELRWDSVVRHFAQAGVAAADFVDVPYLAGCFDPGLYIQLASTWPGPQFHKLAVRHLGDPRRGDQILRARYPDNEHVPDAFPVEVEQACRASR